MSHDLSTVVTCCRCGTPCEPVPVDELTTHYRCPAEDCKPWNIMSRQGPVLFWACFTLEVTSKIVSAPSSLVWWAMLTLPGWGYRRVAWVAAKARLA